MADAYGGTSPIVALVTGGNQASRPWFSDMSQAQSPDQAAGDVLWLATLPAGATEPYGELVQHRVTLPFRGSPLTPQNRTDA
jgi:hypothetical protein